MIPRNDLQIEFSFYYNHHVIKTGTDLNALIQVGSNRSWVVFGRIDTFFYRLL